MEDFDIRVSEVVHNVQCGGDIRQLATILFPIWLPVLAYIVWALVDKLESVSQFWLQPTCTMLLKLIAVDIVLLLIFFLYLVDINGACKCVELMTSVPLREKNEI